MKCKKCKYIKGSSTVEAALIFPIIFIAIILIFYFGILMFQNISSIAASMDAANYIASNWEYIDDSNGEEVKSAKDIIKYEHYEKKNIVGIYADLFLGMFNVDNNEDNPKKQIADEIAQNKIGVIPSYFVDSKSLPLKVEKNSNLLISTIDVYINKKYFNPLYKMINFDGFTLSKEYEYDAKASSVMTNPAEFIRNVNFIKYIINDGSDKDENKNKYK